MSYQQFGHVDPEERLDYVPEGVLEGDDEPLPPRRWPGVVLAVGVMAIFVGGLGFAYHLGSKRTATGNTTTTVASDGVPLIRADTDPVKVKPDKAGGMVVPDKDDPLYSLKPGGAVSEHIQPPPEAPAPRPTAPPPPPPPPQVAQAVPAPTNFPPPLPAPPQIAGAPKPAPKAPEAAKPPPAEAATPGGTVKVQLASLRTPDEARDEWQRIKRENGDLLGRLTAVAVRADLGERGVWYRVEAGPVGDKAAAQKLCKALRDRDLGCQLVQ